MATVVKTVVLSERKQVVEAVRTFHDLWLDLERVTWDSSTREVRMPFSRSVWHRWVGRVDVLLVIGGVIAYEVQDSERVRWYPLRNMMVTGDSVTLEFAIPMKIQMTVAWEAE